MIEKRAIIDDINKVKNYLKSQNTKYDGNYSYKDVVFLPKDGKYDLNKDFIRARVYMKSTWKIKSKVTLVRKNTIWKDGGKVSNLIFKKGFDSEQEAVDFVSRKYNYKKGFEYFTKGWGFWLDSNKIFLEDVESLGPTVEVESENKNELNKILKKLEAKKELEDSMPETMWKNVNRL